MTSLLTDGAQAPTSKACTECGQIKSLSEFNKHARNVDGYQRRCRECFSRYNAQRYASNRERYKLAVKEYKEANPEAVFQTRLRVWEVKPNRKNVYRLVDAALDAGVIVKADHCTICGLPDDEAGGRGLHKHHFDYNDPLKVVWLCPKCHAQIHKLARDRRRKRIEVAA